MKVKIGKYKNWYGPYQLAETLCFWAKDVEDEYGFKSKPQWVHDFGEWLAHGSVEPDEEVPVGARKPLFEPKEQHITWLYKLLLWIDKKKKRTVKIQIDPWDTWGADNTLALIILPILKQLKATTHGAPFVDDEDVPDELKSTAAPPKENDWDTDDNHFKRWDYVLDQMIWAFENIVNDEWQEQFHTGEYDTYLEKMEDGNYLMVKGEKDTSSFDKEGYEAYDARIANGLRLFGRYYRNLWD
jgi:hypothetical protein